MATRIAVNSSIVTANSVYSIVAVQCSYYIGSGQQ